MSAARDAWLLARQGMRGLVRSKTMTGALALAGAAIVLALIVRVVGQASDAEFPQLAAVLLTGLEAPLVALLLGVWAMGAEREGSTLVYLFTRPIRRASVVAGRAAAALALSLAIVVPLGVVCALIYGVPAADIARLCALLALETTTFTSIFVLLGTILPRALYVGLAYATLVEGIVGGIANLGDGLTVGQHARNLLARWLHGSPAVSKDLALPQSAAWSVGVLLVVAAVALAGAGAWAELREMPLRERVKGE